MKWNMEGNKLIKFENGQLQKVGNAIALTGKLLTEKRRQEILVFFIRNPSFFIQLISLYYPLNKVLIKKYRDSLIWNYQGLSENKSLLWTEPLIDEFIDRWNWPTSSGRSFKPIRLWTPLHEMKMLRNKISWQGNGNLSTNEALPWTEGFIDKFIVKWNWERLSVNEGLPWSEDFIVRYYEKWDWEKLSGNKNLPWSESFIKNYQDKWNWKIMSCNEKLPWSESFIEKYIYRWDWKMLSCNESLPWSQPFLEKFKNRLNWDSLSFNKGLPWSEIFFKTYFNKWNWTGLSYNKGLIWSERFIKYYEDKFDWNGLSSNEGLPWSENFVEQYSDKWFWSNLSKNEMFPWSFSFVNGHFDKLLSLSSNNSCWQKVFRSFVDDTMIDEIMKTASEPKKIIAND